MEASRFERTSVGYSLEKMKKWDTYFLDIAKRTAMLSKDPSTQTGAVIANGKNIVSVGYNGFPKDMPDKPENYIDRNEKYSRIVHCEMNALITAGRLPAGTTLYTYPFASCDRCAVHVIQAGIRHFVFPKLPESLKERWQVSLDKTKQYFKECGCTFQEYDYE